jgi:hypothetical protein
VDVDFRPLYHIARIAPEAGAAALLLAWRRRFDWFAVLVGSYDRASFPTTAIGALDAPIHSDSQRQAETTTFAPPNKAQVPRVAR